MKQQDEAKQNDKAIQLDFHRLPRSIELVRNDGRFSSMPLGVPVAVMLDQSRLPYEEVFIETADWRQVMDAIKTLQVRGAPAIGVAGAAAVALRAAEFTWASTDDMRDHVDDLYRTFVLDDQAFDPDLYWTSLEFSAQMIAKARPTAVNLQWAVDKTLAQARLLLDAGKDPVQIADGLFDFVKSLEAADEAANRAIGSNGAALIPTHAQLLTHCNAGSLATVFYGTALGVVYTAAAQGKVRRVFADETRPVNQGSRLTVWELSRVGIPVTLICDDMAASLMASGEVDAVIVGADRIAANGDAANKIGTYGLAVLAHHHGIPFYVAAPSSTVDMTLASGAQIPIEQRDPAEVLPQAIDGVDVWNPCFDVTPARLISRIITDRGVFAPNELAAAYEDVR